MAIFFTSPSIAQSTFDVKNLLLPQKASAVESDILATAESFLAHGFNLNKFDSTSFGVPSVQADNAIWVTVQYLMAYLIVQLSYSAIYVCNDILSFGGVWQNPLLMISNYLSPTDWKSFSYYPFIMTGLYSTTLSLFAAEVAKLFAMFNIIVFGNQGIVTTETMA